MTARISKEGEDVAILNEWGQSNGSVEGRLVDIHGTPGGFRVKVDGSQVWTTFYHPPESLTLDDGRTIVAVKQLPQNTLSPRR